MSLKLKSLASPGHVWSRDLQNAHQTMKLDCNRSKYKMGWSCNCLCVNIVCGGQVINWQLQHSSLLRLQPSWICRIGSGEILGISREVSLAYREEIGHSLFPPVWHPHLQLACISNLDQIDENPSGKGKSGMYQHWQEIGPDCIFQRIFWRQALSPRAGNDPRKFVIIPPPLIRRITCKKHNEQEFSQFRCVQSINPGFLPSGRIINLSEYKKWEYVRSSHRLQQDGHLVTGLCITFITNEHSRERQGAVFRFLRLELLPWTIVCQVDRVGFA